MGSRRLAIASILCIALAGCSSVASDKTEETTRSASAMDPGGDDAVPREPDPVVTEDAVEILKAMAKTLREATRLTFEAETTVEEFLSTGHAIELESRVTATLRRPDRAFSDRVQDGHHRRLYFDGKRLTLQDVDRNLYASREMTGTIDELVDRLEERFGLVMPLADLIVTDSDMALSEFADHGTYVGLHQVRGRTCHHLSFANDALEWQVWVQAEGDPIPRKLVIIYADEPGRPRFSATITKWDLAAEFADETFTFTPPDGAIEIEIVESPASDEGDVTEDEGR